MGGVYGQAAQPIRMELIQYRQSYVCYKRIGALNSALKGT